MIAALFARLWARVWPYLAGLAGIIAGLFYVRQSGKAAGRREAKVKQAEATLKGVEDARNARSEIDALSDDAVRDRARERMRSRAR